LVGGSRDEERIDLENKFYEVREFVNVDEETTEESAEGEQDGDIAEDLLREEGMRKKEEGKTREEYQSRIPSACHDTEIDHPEEEDHVQVQDHETFIQFLPHGLRSDHKNGSQRSCTDDERGEGEICHQCGLQRERGVDAILNINDEEPIDLSHA
jgi:hypothetical protein